MVLRREAIVRATLPSFESGDLLEVGWGIDPGVIVQPEIVLPEQIESLRGQELGGARALMLAVLEEAILCIRGAARSPRAGGVREAQRARLWVKSRDRSWLFSFENVCSALEIDVESLRASVLGSQKPVTSINGGTRSHRVTRGLNRRVVSR
jgi:hypothetical protein